MMDEWIRWPFEGEAGLVAIKANRKNNFNNTIIDAFLDSYLVNDDVITETAHFHNGKWVLDNSLKEPEVIAWIPMPKFKTKIVPL